MKFHIIILFLIAFAGCSSVDREESKSAMTTRRNIDTVKDAHTEELMKIPGVVGLFARTEEDSTERIVVMVAKKTSEIEKQIPKTIEGYPVRIEETGDIQPLK